MTSDINLKKLFGKMLGEIYRIQLALDVGEVAQSTIFGLTHGIETVIDEEIDSIDWVSKEQYSTVCDTLEPYFSDQSALDSLKGFYDIEDGLKNLGVDRTTAIKIITHLKSNNSFTDVIAKFNSNYSPVECKHFDIY